MRTELVIDALTMAVAARGGHVDGVIFQWLTYYNARQHHSSLGYLSPTEFAQQHQRERKLTLAA
ncbi:hypothetical protein ACIBEA_16515 [Streptomyces sp. NPDC051555]|uniref:hypothetical protein n=1 Tax=Streptomyces sp. NPDC051555 TaxID=3365657 RepID=UPI0037A4956F